jgi:hypothetical protein
MAVPPVARSNKTVSWWEYLIIGLIAISSLPAYAAFLMALIAGAILKLDFAFLRFPCATLYAETRRTLNCILTDVNRR